MAEEVKKTKRALRLQVIPFFENVAVYKQALMIANALNIRMTEYIINAMSDYSMSEFKQPLQFDNATDLHVKLQAFAKKRNRSLAGTIEVTVAEYNAKKFKEMQ